MKKDTEQKREAHQRVKAEFPHFSLFQIFQSFFDSIISDSKNFSLLILSFTALSTIFADKF